VFGPYGAECWDHRGRVCLDHMDRCVWTIEGEFGPYRAECWDHRERVCLDHMERSVGTIDRGCVWTIWRGM
jgi:hypothetical protein